MYPTLQIASKSNISERMQLLHHCLDQEHLCLKGGGGGHCIETGIPHMLASRVFSSKAVYLIVMKVSWATWTRTINYVTDVTAAMRTREKIKLSNQPSCCYLLSCKHTIHNTKICLHTVKQNEEICCKPQDVLALISDLLHGTLFEVKNALSDPKIIIGIDHKLNHSTL